MFLYDEQSKKYKKLECILRVTIAGISYSYMNDSIASRNGTQKVSNVILI